MYHSSLHLWTVGAGKRMLRDPLIISHGFDLAWLLSGVVVCPVHMARCAPVVGPLGAAAADIANRSVPRIRNSLATVRSYITGSGTLISSR